MNTTTSIAKTNTLIKLIEERQVDLDITDDQLASALGFERGGILALIKLGSIKFPLNKIPALAGILEQDASDLLVTAMKEYSPDLLNLIEQVWGSRNLTPNGRARGGACRLR